MSVLKQDAAFIPDVATYFLTWHGTLLRMDGVSLRLIHAHVWPVRDVARDWEIALPAGRLAAPVAAADDPRIVFKQADGGRLVTVQRGDDYLCAEPEAGEVRFNRRASGPWEMFLRLTAQELAALRHVLGHAWIDEAGSSQEPMRAAFEGGFTLALGGQRADLRAAFPPISGRGSIIALERNGALLSQGEAVAAAEEIDLTRRPPLLQAPELGDLAAFAATPDSRVALRGEAEYGFLPLALCRAHEDWMLTKWSQPGGRRLGRLRNQCQLVRETDKFVLLTRRREGLVFDARGASNETGYLMGLNFAEAGPLAREGDRIFAAGEALARAPHLAGAHAVFYGGNLSNYYHWLIDALLPLHVMAPYLPAGTKLLMPGTLRGFRELPPEQAAREVDHMAALREWGFGDWPMVDVAEPICRVEEVYWLDECFIEQMPAQFVRAARADVLARMGPAGLGAGGAARNIYITRERTRNVANAAQIEMVARNNGFSVHALEGMSPRAQMELFRDAAFVVAPHGAGLANLLFCAPGTKVLELSPESEFRPLFAQISDKLDLVHAVLPCPTDDGGFFGRMDVDINQFRLLLRQLMLRDGV